MAAPDHEKAVPYDPRFGRLLAATTAGAVNEEIERLIVVEIRPVIASVLRKYTRSGTLLTSADAEDVAAAAELRILEALHAMRSAPQDPIHDLRGWVATLTYNTARDFLRRAFPDRTRLKNRVRYALTNDIRLAMWNVDDGPAGGFRRWRGQPAARAEVPDGIAIRAAERGDSHGEALVEIFSALGEPVLVDALADFLQKEWQISADSTESELPDDVQSTAPDAAARAEDLDFARALWREIRELRPLQRKALLLNLRYNGDVDLLGVLIFSRIATASDLAAALELSVAELIDLWHQLPLDDLAIASMLGVTRQQVINLRKAARERLARRLPR